MFRDASTLCAQLGRQLRGAPWLRGVVVASLNGAPCALVKVSEHSAEVSRAVARAAGPRPRVYYVVRCEPSAPVVGDIIPDLGQADTMARVVRTDRYLEAVGEQYYAARKANRITDPVYKGYAAFWGEWRAYSQKIREEGVNLVRSADVSAQADHYFARGKQFQQDLQKTSPGDVITPIPPDAPPPPKGVGDAVSDAAKAATTIALVLGGIFLVSTLKRGA